MRSIYAFCRRTTGRGPRWKRGAAGVLRGRLVAADPVLSGAVQLIPRARLVCHHTRTTQRRFVIHRQICHENMKRPNKIMCRSIGHKTDGDRRDHFDIRRWGVTAEKYYTHTHFRARLHILRVYYKILL